MKEKIMEILEKELSYVYCHNCKHRGGDNCDYCHRKAIGWQISDKILGELADKIIALV